MTLRTPLFLVAAASLSVALSVSVQVSGQGGQKPVALPDGEGRELVQNTCAKCHGLNLIANSGYTRDGWHTVFSTMVALPKDQAAVIADYLGKNFPEKARPPAVLIPGNVTVSIKEWDVPSLGSRPHDPYPGADGSIWWTGQWADVLGRLDPKTGAMKEYPLKAKSGPHGLAEDKDGNIWYTGNAGAHVGKLDPKTGQVTEYPMPDPAARDPHTPLFDANGTLWFTVQRGNFVGRIIPKTGEVKLAKAPTAAALPYGLVLDSKGMPWFIEFGTNKVASVHPSTMEITEYVLPNAETRSRRLTITNDDLLWIADYERGFLIRFDPKTGNSTEWASPGGPQSLPYGIAAVKDIVWYSEAGVSPNTLVRFDPKTEKFQTFKIPSGGGVVRHMVAKPDGNLVMACSGVNKVALVEVGGGGTSR